MKNMIKHRGESLGCIRKVIVNGFDTLLCTKPWINNQSLVDILDWVETTLSTEMFMFHILFKMARGIHQNR